MIELLLKKTAWFFRFAAASVCVLGLVLAAVILHRSSSPNRSASRIAVETDGAFSSKTVPLKEGHQPTSPASEKRVAVTRALERMPLYFIENRGQLDPRVAYYVQGRDTTLYFTAEGMTLVQTEQRHEKNDSNGRLEKVSLSRGISQTPNPVSRWVVKLDFVGANPNPKITAGNKLSGVISYFKGPREEWKTGLSTYGSIVYSDLWPGIDLVYSGNATRLKYDFLVLQDDRPYAYQEVEGRRVEVSAGYSLDRVSAGGPHRYGFALGWACGQGGLPGL